MTENKTFGHQLKSWMYGTMWWFGGWARHTSGVSKDFSIGIVKKNDLEIKLFWLGCH